MHKGGLILNYLVLGFKTKSARMSEKCANSPNKKLTKEESEKVTQRLFYQQQERAQQLEAKRREILDSVVPKPVTITHETQEALVERIYKQQLERKKRATEENQIKRDALRTQSKTITESEVADMVQRMYYMENEKKLKSKEALRKKYQPDKEDRRLDKTEQEAVGSRLANGYREKKEETRKKLYEKYVTPLNPTFAKISKEQLKSSADRLSAAGAKK